MPKAKDKTKSALCSFTTNSRTRSGDEPKSQSNGVSSSKCDMPKTVLAKNTIKTKQEQSKSKVPAKNSNCSNGALSETGTSSRNGNEFNDLSSEFEMFKLATRNIAFQNQLNIQSAFKKSGLAYDDSNEALEERVNKSIQKYWDYYMAEKLSKLDKNKKYEFIKTQKIIKNDIEPVKRTNWCVVCGEQNRLLGCSVCCASYHKKCFKKFKNKSLISHPNKCENVCDENYKILIEDTCPICSSGMTVGSGSIVWHKQTGFSWWPAKVLSLHEKPPILKRPPSSRHLPLFFYGTENYTWADLREVCQFCIYKENLIKKKNSVFQKALFAASVDYDLSLL